MTSTVPPSHCAFWDLPELRLTGITVLAIVVLSGWLMVHNHLWDSPSGHFERRKALLCNASTALTLSIGVACVRHSFGLALLASIVLVEGTYFAQVLGHPTGQASYLKVVWLATSVGIVGGLWGRALRTRAASAGCSTVGVNGNGSSATSNEQRKPKLAVTAEPPRLRLTVPPKWTTTFRTGRSESRGNS